jgi:hypothetical protein
VRAYVNTVHVYCVSIDHLVRKLAQILCAKSMMPSQSNPNAWNKLQQTRERVGLWQHRLRRMPANVHHPPPSRAKKRRSARRSRGTLMRTPLRSWPHSTSQLFPSHLSLSSSSRTYRHSQKRPFKHASMRTALPHPRVLLLLLPCPLPLLQCQLLILKRRPQRRMRCQ